MSLQQPRLGLRPRGLRGLRHVGTGFLSDGPLRSLFHIVFSKHSTEVLPFGLYLSLHFYGDALDRGSRLRFNVQIRSETIQKVQQLWVLLFIFCYFHGYKLNSGSFWEGNLSQKMVFRGHKSCSMFFSPAKLLIQIVALLMLRNLKCFTDLLVLDLKT